MVGQCSIRRTLLRLPGCSLTSIIWQLHPITYLTLEDDTLMQWCVDNDFCGEAAKAVRYDSDFLWEGEPWPEGAYIISEKDRNAVRLENFCGR